MAQPARKYEEEVGNASWPYPTGNYDVATPNGAFVLTVSKDGSGNLSSTASAQGSGNSAVVVINWDGTTLSWAFNGAVYSGTHVANNPSYYPTQFSGTDNAGNSFTASNNSNAAWTSGGVALGTGPYTVKNPGGTTTFGTLELVTDAAGNLINVSTWTKPDGNTKPVVISWNGTNLSWTWNDGNAAGDGYQPGTCSRVAFPTQFSRGPGLGGQPGGWTATQPG